MTGLTTSTHVFMSRESLAAHLEGQILSGVLPAGSKLPSERQLADRFSVSRPIVREALRMLAERGFVEILPGRGSFVRDARMSDAAGALDALFRRTPATARDLVEARSMVESTAAGLAAQRATAEDKQRIAVALERFDAASSVVDRARYDLAFHLAVAQSAHNPVVEMMFGSITNLMFDLMIRSLSDRVVTGASIPFHAEILEGIRAGDSARARKAMDEHLAVASRFYGKDYDESIEHVARRRLARLLEPDGTVDEWLADEVSPEGKGDDRIK